MRRFLDKKYLLFGILLLALSLVVLQTLKLREYNTCIDERDVLSLRGNVYITWAKTEAEQQKGLSGHAPLLPEEGMLFAFPSASSHGFWMNKMLFPIDIIWLDRDLRVLSVVKSVTPESFPESYYSPPEMQYALEVTSGFAEERNVAAGDRATLNLCSVVQ